MESPYLLGVLIILAIILFQYIWYSYSQEEIAEKLVSDYEKRFPERCGVCALHLHKVRQGYAKIESPDPHFCRQQGKWVGEDGWDSDWPD